MSHISLNPLTRAGSFTPPTQGLLQRKCGCGNRTAGGGHCEECAKNKNSLQRQMRVGSSNDPLEHEADRVADQVLSNQSAPAISSFSFGQLQREEKSADKPKEKTDKEKYEEGAKKLGEAFLETPVGKQLIERLKQDALVKGATQIGKDFIATWPGKIVTGAAAAGTITALAAAHKELPIQIPEIPLDVVTPGLSVKLTYNGPVDKPTDAMLTFKFSEQAPAAGSASKRLTEAEKFSAETARMAADQARFRASMITPGSPEDLQQKAEQQAINKFVQKRYGGFDIEAEKKKYPWLATPEAKTGFQLNKPTFGYQGPSIFGEQFKFKLLDEKKKKNDEPEIQKKLTVGSSNDPLEAEADRVADQVLANNSGTAEINHSISSVQRHSTSASESTDEAPASVTQTLSGLGAPLDKTTRADMESRFGQDFSHVRIHQGSTAEKSAREVNANAYTLGNNIVFGAGQFNPTSQTGKRLLAHELTHVIQQSNVIRPYRSKDAFNFGKYDTPELVEDSFNQRKDKEKKSWIKNVDVKFAQVKADSNGNNYWEGEASAHYFSNFLWDDFKFPISGGSSELGKSHAGNFTVSRIEGVGYNSGKYSGKVDKNNREGPLKRYSKDLNSNMHFAVFYNGGEALHSGPLNISSHGCVHVDWANIQRLNYHSVIGLTKVSVTYP